MAVDLTKVNYILLKSDGSVLAQNMDYYVLQGSTGVDKIFFGSLAAVNTDIGQAICTLPNGEQNTLIGTWDTCTYEIEGVETTIGGFLFTLTTDQTNYNGGLTMALAIYRSQNRLVNYPLYLVINETGLMSDTNTGVTVEEINSYLQQVEQMLRVDNSILVVDNMTYAIAANKVVGQIFFNKYDGLFYIKNQEAYPFYTEYTGFGYVPKAHLPYRVYVTNINSQDTSILYTTGTSEYSIVQRAANGQINVPLTPTEIAHATSKKYVDDNYVPYTGATKNVDLGNHKLSTSNDINMVGFSNAIRFEQGDNFGEIYLANQDLFFRTAGGAFVIPGGTNGDAVTKSYVDNLVATIKANAFIVVDAQEYPNFPDGYNGEEGYIYLYPSSIPEEGFLEYIWEGNSWLQIGTTELDLTNYYTKSEVDDIADNIKADVPKHQSNTILITDELTNINGRVFQNYTKTDVTIGGYPAIKILKSGNKLSEEDAAEYMYYMTGSDFVPKYNYDFPRCSYFIMPNGQLLKPQFDSTNGLVLYYSGRIATTDYAVEKTNNGEKVYGTDELGAQTTYDVDSDLVGSGAIVRRETGTGTVVVGTPTSNTHATTKQYVDNAISNAIASVYRIKGSKTVAQLNAMTSADLTAGDVYNVTDSGTLTAGNIDVFTGDNVVWTGSAWDKLGTEIDWSAYDEKFMAAGFFEVQNYNESTGEITMVYATELYDMSYNSDTGVMTIEAN